MRVKLPSLTLDPEGARRAEGWIKPLTFPFVWHVVDKLLIDKFLFHTESTEFTDFFSLLCDAGAGINAAYARGIHRDLTIPNANRASRMMIDFGARHHKTKS